MDTQDVESLASWTGISSGTGASTSEVGGNEGVDEDVASVEMASVTPARRRARCRA